MKEGNDGVSVATNAPISFEEKEKLLRAILTDFHPMKAAEIKKELHGWDDKKANVLGLKVQDFIDYETKHNLMGQDMFVYYFHIIVLIQKLCNDAVMYSLGNIITGISLLDAEYYSIFNPYDESPWDRITTYADYLGLDYIKEKVRKYEALICVIDKYEDEHQGTGTLIAENVILTCKHVTDKKKYHSHRIFIEEKEYEIKDIIESPEKDISLIYIKECNLNPKDDIIFGTGKELENIVTFGFPPIPLIPHQVLICQKGEINAFTEDRQNNKYLIISSIVRPGNSGGAIMSESGYFVGMVTESKESLSLEHRIKIDTDVPIETQISSLVDQINRLPQIVPFYSGLMAKDIYEEVMKLNKELVISTNYKNKEEQKTAL